MIVAATRKRLTRSSLTAAIAVAGALAWTSPGTTHPHIWIDAAATLVFEHGALVGVDTQWTLDPFVSALLIEDFDENDNGVFDADEAAAIEQLTFVGLSEFGFYTHLRVDGVEASPETVQQFQPTISGDTVLYSFFVPLPEPADPTRQRVDVAFYDETYYTDLYVEDGWIAVRGDETSGCVPTLRLDTDSPYYFGIVFPTRIGLRCAEG